jgi:predicted metal-dependent phosphoesterase TrpH
MADAMGLRALALTDHDTLDGLDRFLDMQGATSVRLVPGIELSCEFVGRDLHVLGLFVDHRDPVFGERIRGLQARRLRRNERIFGNLRGLGIDIGSLAPHGHDGQMTRGHIADMLVAAGRVASRGDAFRKYLGEDGAAYAPFDYLSPADAFSWIREAGGLPAIAHPGRFAGGAFVWDAAMAEFRSQGALGVEAHYSEHSPAQTAYFLWLCDELGMAPTGGSDYHGAMKPWCRMGVGRGDLAVPDTVLDRILKMLGDLTVANNTAARRAASGAKLNATLMPHPYPPIGS